MSTNTECAGHWVEGACYDTLKEISDEYEISYSALCRRHRRGKSGDDLIPQRKTLAGVEARRLANCKHVADGECFKSLTALCRHHEISYASARRLLRRGVAIKNIVDRYKSAKSPHKPVCMDSVGAKGKSIEVAGLKFDSIAEAARQYREAPENVRNRLKRGATVEQALGITTWSGRHNVFVKNKYFSSLREAGRYYKISYEYLKDAVSQGRSLDEAANSYKRQGGVGRFCKKIISRDKETAAQVCFLYLLELSIGATQYFKIGITTRSVARRASEVGNSAIALHAAEADVERCFKWEQELLSRIDRRDFCGQSCAGIDGKTEIFEHRDRSELIEEFKATVRADCNDCLREAA